MPHRTAYAEPQEILDFWFSPGMEKRWFAGDADLDRLIAERFTVTQEAATRGDCDSWSKLGPAGLLALVIVLDQFPRNLFRGRPGAFSTDADALEWARVALDKGDDHGMSVDERSFLCMPFMHSEDLADQERSVALFAEIGKPDSLDFAIQHRDIIARFGRFPHRNAILGRQSTAEEIEFLKTHKGF